MGAETRQSSGKGRGELVVTNLRNRTKDFFRGEDGPTATEYAVMLALIIVAAIGAIQLIGAKVSDTFTSVESALPTVGGSSPAPVAIAAPSGG